MPCRGLASERDPGDTWMTNQRLAHATCSRTVDHVVHTRRHTDLVHHLAEQGGCGRARLGRFDHHGIPGRQRRSQLPGQKNKRKVPRADQSDHAQRDAQGILHGLRAVRELADKRFAGQVRRHASELAKCGRSAWNVKRARHGRRTTGIANLGLDEALCVGLDAVGHGV